MVVAPHQRLHAGAAMLLLSQLNICRQFPASFLSPSSPAKSQQVPAALARCLHSW